MRWWRVCPDQKWKDECEKLREDNRSGLMADSNNPANKKVFL